MRIVLYGRKGNFERKVIYLKEELLTVKEVAEYVKMSRASVFKLSRNGGLPKGVKIGGVRRWRLSELEAFINSQEVKE